MPRMWIGVPDRLPRSRRGRPPPPLEKPSSSVLSFEGRGSGRHSLVVFFFSPLDGQRIESLPFSLFILSFLSFRSLSLSLFPVAHPPQKKTNRLFPFRSSLVPGSARVRAKGMRGTRRDAFERNLFGSTKAYFRGQDRIHGRSLQIVRSPSRLVESVERVEEDPARSFRLAVLSPPRSLPQMRLACRSTVHNDAGAGGERSKASELYHALFRQS